jgi:polyhydroxyalkanoate synthesis regulator protein
MLGGKQEVDLAEKTPVLVKRYAKDRLYDPAAGRYLTIADLRKWAARAVSFTVFDAETGEDITRILLA